MVFPRKKQNMGYLGRGENVLNLYFKILTFKSNWKGSLSAISLDDESNYFSSPNVPFTHTFLQCYYVSLSHIPFSHNCQAQLGFCVLPKDTWTWRLDEQTTDLLISGWISWAAAPTLQMCLAFCFKPIVKMPCPMLPYLFYLFISVNITYKNS